MELLEHVRRKSIVALMEGGGQAAGSMEIDDADPHEAAEFLKKRGLDVSKAIPKFFQNFKRAQIAARAGWMQRKDMPVLDGEAQVRNFQTLLKTGAIDITKPFSKAALGRIKKTGSAFPPGLTGKRGLDFLQQGRAEFDSHASDDMVKVSNKMIAVGELKPIQKQIYFDKSGGEMAQHGVEASKKFMTSPKTLYVVSSDNYILDGHHRWLSSMIIDPTMKVNCAVIDLPLDQLLPLSIAVGDVYNKGKRNA